MRTPLHRLSNLSSHEALLLEQSTSRSSSSVNRIWVSQLPSQAAASLLRSANERQKQYQCVFVVVHVTAGYGMPNMYRDSSDVACSTVVQTCAYRSKGDDLLTGTPHRIDTGQDQQAQRFRGQGFDFEGHAGCQFPIVTEVLSSSGMMSVRCVSGLMITIISAAAG